MTTSGWQAKRSQIPRMRSSRCVHYNFFLKSVIVTALVRPQPSRRVHDSWDQDHLVVVPFYYLLTEYNAWNFYKEMIPEALVTTLIKLSGMRLPHGTGQARAKKSDKKGPNEDKSDKSMGLKCCPEHAIIIRIKKLPALQSNSSSTFLNPINESLPAPVETRASTSKALLIDSCRIIAILDKCTRSPA